MPPATRRPLFLHGGLQMLACYITLAALLGVEFHRCADPSMMHPLNGCAIMTHLIILVLSVQPRAQADACACRPGEQVLTKLGLARLHPCTLHMHLYILHVDAHAGDRHLAQVLTQSST